VVDLLVLQCSFGLQSIPAAAGAVSTLAGRLRALRPQGILKQSCLTGFFVNFPEAEWKQLPFPMWGVFCVTE